VRESHEKDGKIPKKKVIRGIVKGFEGGGTHIRRQENEGPYIIEKGKRGRGTPWRQTKKRPTEHDLGQSAERVQTHVF